MTFAFCLAVLLAAATVSLTLTAVVRRLFPRLGLIDRPDGRRKLHLRPVPVGGGAAVWLATLTVLGALWLLPTPWRDDLQSAGRQILALLAAGSAIVALGLADDRFKLRGRHKLLGQAAAAGILIAGGFVFERISLFGWDFELGMLKIPFVLVWLVGAVNTINLLDGIDGLATTLGIILAATIAAMAVLTGSAAVALVALVFAGSLLGFLRWNFPPASVFLGDTGSMLIGLVVGALAIQASLKGPGTVLLAASLGVWTIPILDTLAAILRRKLTGRSIYTTDRCHLHHRLLALLGSNLKVLAGVVAVCAVTSAATLVSLFLKNDSIALVASLGVVTVLIATGIFGRAEFSLVSGHLRGLGRSLLGPLARNGNGDGAHQSVVRFQGSLPWEQVWSRLIDSAEGLELNQLRLDVHLPADHEEYHATWNHPFREALESGWRLQTPLMVGDKAVGTVTVVGEHGGGCARQDIGKFLELLVPIEADLVAVAERHVWPGNQPHVCGSPSGPCERNDELAVALPNHPR